MATPRKAQPPKSMAEFEQYFQPKQKGQPPAESNRAKFVRLVNGRVNSALHAIRLIGNLANRQLYDYDEPDVIRIKQILEASVTVMIDKFTQRDRKEWVFDVEGEATIPDGDEK